MGKENIPSAFGRHLISRGNHEYCPQRMSPKKLLGRLGNATGLSEQDIEWTERDIGNLRETRHWG